MQEQRRVKSIDEVSRDIKQVRRTSSVTKVSSALKKLHDGTRQKPESEGNAVRALIKSLLHRAGTINPTLVE